MSPERGNPFGAGAVLLAALVILSAALCGGLWLVLLQGPR